MNQILKKGIRVSHRFYNIECKIDQDSFFRKYILANNLFVSQLLLRTDTYYVEKEKILHQFLLMLFKRTNTI